MDLAVGITIRKKKKKMASLLKQQLSMKSSRLGQCVSWEIDITSPLQRKIKYEKSSQLVFSSHISPYKVDVYGFLDLSKKFVRISILNL
jgi:hypothetical protein